MSSVVAVLIGVQPNNLQCNIRNRLCNLCTGRWRDDAKHILLGCEALAQARHIHYNEILTAMPFAMRHEFNRMTLENKLYFIISGLQCDYNKEWAHIYKAMAKFVYELYRKRKLLYQD